MGIRSILRGNGDHGSLARGDATQLMPSAGGAGRFPGPPPRTAVGGADPDRFPGPPPRGSGIGGSYPSAPPPGSGSSGNEGTVDGSSDLRPDHQQSLSTIMPTSAPPRLPPPPDRQAPRWTDAPRGTYGKHDDVSSRLPLMKAQNNSSSGYRTAAPPKEARIAPKKRPGGSESGAPPVGWKS